MNFNLPFERNHAALLLALVSAAFAHDAGAAAGRVDFASGGATVSGADGRPRPLTRGTDLDKGDTVRTDAAGRAQIRFSDGAYVSLQPNTEFAIKEYNFDGKTDGSERGIFALARGAMRTVTGLIGRVNRNRYQVSTPTATIGIRGTGGLIAILNDGSTLINGTSGIWTLTNPSGTIDVPAGVSGKAPSAPNQPPQQTTEKPSTGPTQPSTTQQPYTQAEQRTETGATQELCGTGLVTNCTTTAAVNPNPPLVTGSGYHVSYAYGGQLATGAPAFGVNSALATATFDAIGKMTQFTGGLNSATFIGSSPDFGTAGGVVAWGRWIGPMTVVDGSPGPGPVSLVPPNSNQGYHYIVGIPATAMPTTGSASFTFMGATTPTGSDGSLTGGSFAGTLSVTNWATGAMTVGATVAFTGPSTFSHTFNSGASGVTFSAGSPAFQGTATVANNIAAPTGYQCSGGCSAKINGAFFGAGAAYAGFAYQIIGTTGGQAISGTAAFKQ